MRNEVSYDMNKPQKRSPVVSGTPATKGILINECFVGEEEQLAILIDRLKLLRDRVHSVLNVGQNGVDAETKREEFPVPMGERIITHIDDIKVCRDIVEDILDRLEI